VEDAARPDGLRPRDRDQPGRVDVEVTERRAEIDVGVPAAEHQREHAAWAGDLMKIAKTQNHNLKNGILYFKGGDLTEELQIYKTATLYDLSDYFTEDFFETKKVVHLPIKFKG
jgi:hypothetical protein